MSNRGRWLWLLTALALTGTRAVAGQEGAIQCANLIYGGTHTSRCFSDAFLTAVQQQTTIPTERRFISVKLGDDELFTYPFVVMTGESSFQLTAHERENLKRYLTRGGFLVASAGCSNPEWDKNFRRELKVTLGEDLLRKIEMDHPVFRTVKTIESLKLHRTEAAARLEGVEVNGKLVVIYSPHGLNDTAHTEGCCCCGGNEVSNALEILVNIFVYALLH